MMCSSLKAPTMGRSNTRCVNSSVPRRKFLRGGPGGGAGTALGGARMQNAPPPRDTARPVDPLHACEACCCLCARCRPHLGSGRLVSKKRPSGTGMSQLATMLHRVAILAAARAGNRHKWAAGGYKEVVQRPRDDNVLPTHNGS